VPGEVSRQQAGGSPAGLAVLGGMGGRRATA
jgi:hypothetical protein